MKNVIYDIYMKTKDMSGDDVARKYLADALTTSLRHYYVENDCDIQTGACKVHIVPDYSTGGQIHGVTVYLQLDIDSFEFERTLQEWSDLCYKTLKKVYVENPQCEICFVYSLYPVVDVLIIEYNIAKCVISHRYGVYAPNVVKEYSSFRDLYMED